MTETYQGDWNPTVGDKKPYVRFPDDVYHRYPAARQAKAEVEKQPVRTEQTVAQSG